MKLTLRRFLELNTGCDVKVCVKEVGDLDREVYSIDITTNDNGDSILSICAW